MIQDQRVQLIEPADAGDFRHHGWPVGQHRLIDQPAGMDIAQDALVAAGAIQWQLARRHGHGVLPIRRRGLPRPDSCEMVMPTPE
ncbi:hypothetical protein E3D03_007980 [Paracoccus sp. DMF]|nr:hypothetical protein [Paracoccus sp. DMF]